MRNLKKVIALVAVFALLVSTVAFAQTYSDVAETDAYAEAIETLSMLGILTGDDADGDGQMDFRPADTITRAEVAAIVCRIQNMNSAAQTTTPFTDVPSTHWASGYVSQAAGQGIVNGYGDGNFGPDDNVTYEQVIKMLMETLGYNLFAADNGGYPTGYLTAAQRYGVLEGVIGGGSGTEANRGMVAQMVYNAIDTPLMDKYYYGKDATYMIYDGTNAKYMTLMSRDLKIVKASGTVTANSYTTLGSTGATVDLEAEKKMVLKADGSDVNAWYLSLAEGETKTFKQGDVNADALLGYAVNIYAKQNTNGTYTLLSATKDSAKNETVSFTLDLYDGLDTTSKTTFEYLKDEDASSASTATLATNADVIINGVAVAGDAKDYFADSITTGKIGPEGKYNTSGASYNGSVTLVDTKDATGYDLVVVELATTAVVNKVGSTGLVTFLNKVNLPVVSGGAIATSALANLSFDEEDTDYMITLTKDGEEIDFTELQKWDVLSIKNGAVGDIYDVSVLGEANYVDSYVKATRNSDGKVLLADGNLYDVASNGYKVNGLVAGDSGRFYIDAYGKIVALDDKVTVEGVDAAIADNYAIVLNAVDGDDTWGKMNVTVQILDKSGAVYEAQLASNVTYKNLDYVDATLASTLDSNNANDFSYKTESLTANNAKSLAKALAGQMISYTANSAGAISAVTFAQGNDEDEDLFAVTSDANKKAIAVNGDFDEDDMQIGSIDIDEDTYVFYFTRVAGTAQSADKVQYGTGYAGAADYSRVGKGSELADGNYDYVAFDNADGAAKAIVILNTTGAISPAAHVAVIDGVGKSSSNGNTVYIVDYWMNGEKLSATTTVDLNEITDQNAKKGDIFQLNVSNGTITAANKVFTMTRNADNTVNGYTSVSLDNKTGGVFGAIYDENARGNLKLRLNGTDTGVIKANDAETANVYVIDPNKSDARQIYVGSLANAYVDENLTEVGNKIDVNKDGGSNGNNYDVLVDANGAADYLLDYAYAYQYEGDAIDIVIYKPYTFTYTLVF